MIAHSLLVRSVFPESTFAPPKRMYPLRVSPWCLGLEFGQGGRFDSHSGARIAPGDLIYLLALVDRGR